MDASILMPTYNGEKYILEQLESILKQTRQADEVIICDDGSQDNTCFIIESFIKTHHLTGSWFLFKNERHFGYPYNFYNCIEKSHCELLFFSDQDDIWDLKKIENMLRIMEIRDDIELLCCKYVYIKEDGTAANSIIKTQNKLNDPLTSININSMLKCYYYPGMAMCTRRSFYDKIKNMICTYKNPHDWLFALFACDEKSFYYYDYIGVFHRVHTTNVSGGDYRISRILNLSKKIMEINKMISNLQTALKFDRLNNDTKQELDIHLQYMMQRLNGIQNRNLFLLLRTHIKKFRIQSLFSDMFLILLGDYALKEKDHE